MVSARDVKKILPLFFVMKFLSVTHSIADAPHTNYTISSIKVTGASTLPERTIIDKTPFHVGEPYWPDKANVAISNIYHLGIFQQVSIKPIKKSDTCIDLLITVKEKPALQEIIFEGNKNLSKKDIQKKIPLDTIKAAVQSDIDHIAHILESLYKEKGYLFAKVTGTLKKTPSNNSVSALIKVVEGPQSAVRKVRFVSDNGDKLAFHQKHLRSLLHTKEDWIFGALDRSGVYHPQALEVDTYTIENFYQSNGYLHAKVLDTKTELSNKNKDMTVTFTVHEGDRYTINSVNAPGNDILTEQQLLRIIPLYKGNIYSKELVRTAIERLKTIWGDYGYIYASIDPAIEPDEENKTVGITFFSELGKKVKLNRISIKGHNKTRDKVIRRRLLVQEQELLTTTKLELSKQLVNGLGYFNPQNGVNWKINRIDDDTANLDVLVEEIKTGRFEAKLTYGGAPNSLASSNTGIAGELSVIERNLFGKGLILQAQTRLGADNQSIEAGFTQPWLFDKPIRVGVNGLYNHSEYDEIRKVMKTIEERQANLAFDLGFVSQTLFDTAFILQSGFTSIDLYSESLDGTTKVKPQASEMGGNRTLQQEYQSILNEQLKSGKFLYTEVEITQDTRNHTTHISQGYKWDARAKLGIPAFHETFGFIKLSFDSHWYTPLIDEHTLVLHLHTYLGFVHEIGNNTVPYRELYHIGGQSSVRGWTFGQISPMWYAPDQIRDEDWQGNSIGARKAFFLNAELVFPIRSDLSLKGVIFYDGGSGWDAPLANAIDKNHLKNNSFDYRHSIGFGVRLLHPQPMRVDWAFKLDKRTGETDSEVSFASYYDF